VREWIEQALQTNWLKVKIRGEGVDAECRRCRMQIEMAQLEYKARHDRMGLRVYWELRKKYGVSKSVN